MFIGEKGCSVCYLSDRGRLFQISYQGEEIFIYFETRLFPKFPSELMFDQSVLKDINLGCLAYGVVTVKAQVTCVTNEVIKSKHDCRFELYFCDYDTPVILPNCKLYTRNFPVHPDNSFSYQILHFSQEPRHMSLYTKHHCKFCVNFDPPSLKFLYVNKLLKIQQ